MTRRTNDGRALLAEMLRTNAGRALLAEWESDPYLLNRVGASVEQRIAAIETEALEALRKLVAVVELADWETEGIYGQQVEAALVEGRRILEDDAA